VDLDEMFLDAVDIHAYALKKRESDHTTIFGVNNCRILNKKRS
jgi:hypothetical protein